MTALRSQLRHALLSLLDPEAEVSVEVLLLIDGLCTDSEVALTFAILLVGLLCVILRLSLGVVCCNALRWLFVYELHRFALLGVGDTFALQKDGGAGDARFLSVCF